MLPVFAWSCRHSRPRSIASNYTKSAEQGNADAQFCLGGMYDDGRGVPQDYGKAVEWYTKSAGQGYARAQNNLGGMYDYGRGVPQDYGKALEWYTKSAEQGSFVVMT